MLVLLIGGARSGKSRLAVRMALEQHEPVTFLACAEAGDDEMAVKIGRHRRERPDGWRTVEAPLRLREAIAAVAGERCLIVDCLTVWTANRLAAGGARETAAGGAEETLTLAAEAAAAAAARPGLTIAVTNEVGLGVHPYSSLGREFRDLLGSVNLAWAELAERAYLVVAGRALALEDACTLTLEAGRAFTLESEPAPLPEETV
jgi:adenosyl cobinamide kinase/adenosyl cobinamide phosphate guanylyltransferase